MGSFLRSRPLRFWGTGVLAHLGVFVLVEWRGCVLGMRMELLNTHTACVDGVRVHVPLDYEAVGAE